MSGELVELDGKVAIVTGGAQGIGREYSRALASRGATVVVADTNVDGARETAAIVGGDGGRAIPAEVDVASAASVAALAGFVREQVGPASILVNNAGIYHTLRSSPLLEVDIDYWRFVMSVNLDGALLMTQAIAPQMYEVGWGRVVSQSSIAAYGGRGSAYTVSKLALIGLTQGLANDLGPKGITVNAIAPGPIFTEATMTAPAPGVIDGILANTPINRRVEPDGLNGLLLFLMSEGASWITGQTLIVDGGHIKRL